MGLYDTIRCSATLPGKPPAFVLEPNHEFQTKDLDCSMSDYEITADGCFVDSNGKPVDGGHFTGTIDFYDGNTSGCANGITFTANGEDAEWVGYRAVFFDGRLISITETERTREPALPESARKQHIDTRTPESDATREARVNESLAGRTMFLCSGGSDISEGREVTVVYDGPREWAVLHGPGDPERPHYSDNSLEVIDRRMRDCLLWDSREAAQEARDEGDTEAEQEAREYADMMSKRTAERKEQP